MDVTIIIRMLYVRNDPIRLVWMVKQADRLNASSTQPPVLPCSGRRQRRRPEHGERYSWVSALAYQPDSPTARGGGGPEHVPKWRWATLYPPEQGMIEKMNSSDGEVVSAPPAAVIDSEAPLRETVRFKPLESIFDNYLACTPLGHALFRAVEAGHMCRFRLRAPGTGGRLRERRVREDGLGRSS